ncbi:MAG: type transport system ATP-binding protein, partial [Thermoleophilaceae bacterium]|nr:type transport system ATP-binding protein [Thermoleophilaceae bacterium]
MPDFAPGAVATAAQAAAADQGPESRAGAAASPHAAVTVAGLEKTFKIPKHQVQTLKERALHPLRRREYDELAVLRGVSFDIRAGEFFGIVGRNGSGKSTLLKCIAGIYQTDSGSI